MEQIKYESKLSTESGDTETSSRGRRFLMLINFYINVNQFECFAPTFTKGFYVR